VKSTGWSSRVKVSADGDGVVSHAGAVLTWVTTAVFGLCALLGAVNADLGLFSLLLLVVVRVAEAAAPALTGRGGRRSRP